jgi:hypothetical protein
VDAEGNSIPGTINSHRLQVGGLEFRSRGGWKLSLGGGVEYAPIDGTRTREGFQSGISKSSKSTQLSLVYHRGFSVAVGEAAALRGHDINLSFNQLLSPRLNLQMSSQYNHSSSQPNSTLAYLTGRAQLGVVLHPHMMLSADYWYVSQRIANPAVGVPAVHRYTVSMGLQLFSSTLGTPKERR